MTVEQTRAALERLSAMRHEAGRAAAPFEVALPLAEPVTQAAVDAVRALGIDDLVVIAPWLPSPWDTASWLDAGDDMSLLQIKKKALERHAAAVLRKVR
jgi:hypothetical protein